MDLFIIAAGFLRSISGPDTTVPVYQHIFSVCCNIDASALPYNAEIKGTENLSMLQSVRGIPLEQLYN
jgi:hypothetical protein